ncbi:transcriptional regulator [Putridiphycobacter roseus]|uniref:Transcriptional regulator n=1 Tax=Putridiphycobacter roseus TaxID=2219161 RepID=A0A2W1NJP1_9FLAO|nr:helix-turn-helix domain-containing protein [Putridiphycobacter roseus]PZE15832.1 transcriptional regulator [Putridiphycobacter roseus]
MKKSNPTDCSSAIIPVRDALDVISGKWKILILISITHGNKRFTEIQKSVPKITAKVLSKELKDLEEHLLIERKIIDDYPVRIEYSATPHSQTLSKLVKELQDWGVKHRAKIIGK